MAKEKMKVSTDPSAEGLNPQAQSKGSQPGDKATPETDKAKASNSKEGKSARKRSAGSKRRSNLARFTPMVRFDSQTHILSFTRKGSVDGMPVMTDPVKLDLSLLDESARQAVIAGVKFSMNFSNGVALEDAVIQPMEKTPKAEKKASEEPVKAANDLRKANPFQDIKAPSSSE